MQFDIYLVGVGGQGILTIGEILAEAIRMKGTPVNFFPSKGMAQRGGFVKAQLRIGRELVGPNIPEKGAHLIIAMEISEALKAVKFSRPDGDFILLGDRWLPVSVIFGKEKYPEVEIVQEQIIKAKSRLHYLDLQALPVFKGAPIPPNIFILGYAMRATPLGKLVDKESVLDVVRHRWSRSVDINSFAFLAGWDTEVIPNEVLP